VAVWIHAPPQGGSDKRHDHHSALHPLRKTLEDITNAAARNSALKPAEIAQGEGIGYVPGVVDQACTNLERVARIVKKARQPSNQGRRKVPRSGAAIYRGLRRNSSRSISLH